VTDSLGTEVKLFSGSNLLADLIIGKFSFSQPQKMTSYVRLKNEKEVYGIDGMIGMSFNRNMNAFRDRTLISSFSSGWSELTFSYPADSSFVLEKTGDNWIIDGQPADSASVAEYLNSVSNLNDSRFADSDAIKNLILTHSLVIAGVDGADPVEIKGYFSDEDNFIVESRQNEGNFFNSKELAEKIFVSKQKLTGSK